MKTLSYFFATTVLVFAVACSDNLEKEPVPLPEDVEEQNEAPKLSKEEVKVLYQMRHEDNKVPLEEAAQLANDVIGFLDGESALKSGAARRIDKVTALRSGNGRTTLKVGDSAEVTMPDTMAYLFDFADSAGFAIVAADTRVETPVLSYSGSGNLAGGTNSGGMGIFLSGAQSYLERSIIAAEHLKDSLINEIYAKIEEFGEVDTVNMAGITLQSVNRSMSETVTTETWTIVNGIGPLVLVEWGQNYPYNSLLGTCNNGAQRDAGCVSVAVAQLMTHWGVPQDINGMAFDWSLLRKYTKKPNRSAGMKSVDDVSPEANIFRQQVAQLMKSLNEKIGALYVCGEGTFAFPWNAINFLMDNGYSYRGDWDDGWGGSYSRNDVFNSLSSHMPILIYGTDHEIRTPILDIKITDDWTNAHAWLIDGCCKGKRRITVTTRLYNVSTLKSHTPIPSSTTTVRTARMTTITQTYYEYADYLHNNWGWDGKDNGYFFADCFNAKKRVQDPSPKSSGQDYDFRYGIHIYPYLSATQNSLYPF